VPDETPRYFVSLSVHLYSHDEDRFVALRQDVHLPCVPYPGLTICVDDRVEDLTYAMFEVDQVMVSPRLNRFKAQTEDRDTDLSSRTIDEELEAYLRCGYEVSADLPLHDRPERPEYLSLVEESEKEPDP
jgi:hypothetical protein